MGMGKQLTKGSAVAVPITIALDVVDEVFIKETDPRALLSWDYGAEVTEESAKAVVSVAAGFAATAATSAITGATIGSVIPGLGTAVGLAELDAGGAAMSKGSPDMP